MSSPENEISNFVTKFRETSYVSKYEIMKGLFDTLIELESNPKHEDTIKRLGDQLESERKKVEFLISRIHKLENDLKAAHEERVKFKQVFMQLQEQNIAILSLSKELSKTDVSESVVEENPIELQVALSVKSDSIVDSGIDDKTPTPDLQIVSVVKSPKTLPPLDNMAVIQHQLIIYMSLFREQIPFMTDPEINKLIKMGRFDSIFKILNHRENSEQVSMQELVNLIYSLSKIEKGVKFMRANSFVYIPIISLILCPRREIRKEALKILVELASDKVYLVKTLINANLLDKINFLISNGCHTADDVALIMEIYDLICCKECLGQISQKGYLSIVANIGFLHDILPEDLQSKALQCLRETSLIGKPVLVYMIESELFFKIVKYLDKKTKFKLRRDATTIASDVIAMDSGVLVNNNQCVNFFVRMFLQDIDPFFQLHAHEVILRCLSNHPKVIQPYLQGDFFTKLVKQLKSDNDVRVQYKAINTTTIILRHGMTDATNMLVKCKFLDPYCNLLKRNDQKISRVVIGGIYDYLLKFKDGVDELVKNETRDNLEKIARVNSFDFSNKAAEILKKFFGVEI